MSEKPKDDGGRAFPNDGAWANNNPEGGMSLRDWFAAAALPQLILTAGNTKESMWPVTVPEVAQKAYQFADAMLIERAKP